MRANAHVGTANCRYDVEDLCFNNYCDIGARVCKANQCRCAYVCVCGVLCQAARGRADGRERRTGNRSMRGEQGSPPSSSQWICARRVLGASLEGGLSPPFKMATSHSSIGLDMTAPPRARSTTVLSSGFTPLRVTRTVDWLTGSLDKLRTDGVLLTFKKLTREQTHHYSVRAIISSRS